MGVPEKERKEKKIFELKQAEKFPKLMTDNKLQFQKTWRTSSLINDKKFIPGIPGHIMFKLKKTKNKEKLEEVRG